MGALDNRPSHWITHLKSQFASESQVIPYYKSAKNNFSSRNLVTFIQKTILESLNNCVSNIAHIRLKLGSHIDSIFKTF